MVFVTTRNHAAIVQGEKNTHQINGEHWKGRSGWAASPEIIRERCGIQPNPCKECGNIFSDTWCEPYKTICREEGICHGCQHDRKIYEKQGDPRSAVVDGVSYWIEPDGRANYGSIGHGGAEFRILFNDGRFVVSHNLWCQGDIKAAWRDRIPDNARFLRYNEASPTITQP